MSGRQAKKLLQEKGKIQKKLDDDEEEVAKPTSSLFGMVLPKQKSQDKLGDIEEDVDVEEEENMIDEPKSPSTSSTSKGKKKKKNKKKK